MKVKNLIISLGLLLVSGACAFVGINFSRNGIQKASAHSTTGLTLVTSANSETFIGCTAYIIGNNTEFGLNTSNRAGRNGTLLELTIADGTSGSTIQLTRSDDKYLSNLVNGSWSDSAANVYIDSSNRLGTNASGDNYWRAVKFPGDSTIYYEQYSPGQMGTTQSVFYVYAVPAPDPAEVDATTFAQTLKDTTDGICKDTSKGPTDTDLDDLAAVWNAKEIPDGTSLVEKWNALSNEAKATFTTGTANETIADANERYVHIMSRYGDTLTEFVDGPAFSANHVINILNKQYNNSVMIVMIVTTSALVLVGLVTFLALKKRRN